MVDYQYLIENCGTWGWWWHGVHIAEFHGEGKWVSLLHPLNHTGIAADVEREAASDEWDRGFYFPHAVRHRMIYWLWLMSWCFHYWCTEHHLYSVLMTVAAVLWECLGNLLCIDWESTTLGSLTMSCFKDKDLMIYRNTFFWEVIP